MNYNEEIPDFLGELGDMLPADVLKKVCPRQPVRG